MTNLASLHDLFIEQLQDLYDAEHRLIEALPKMADAAQDENLSKAFRDHLKETTGHIDRLEKAFRSIGEEPKRKTCAGIKGLIAEGEEFVKGKHMKHPVQDAGLIAAAQRVEHYEIAGYGCVLSYAQSMGHDVAAKLLEQTLHEEKNADALLSGIAENDVNPAAQDLNEDENMRTGATKSSYRIAGART